jgi:formylglycine-generating enzyme required for sulfatase activity
LSQEFKSLESLDKKKGAWLTGCLHSTNQGDPVVSYAWCSEYDEVLGLRAILTADPLIVAKTSYFTVVLELDAEQFGTSTTYLLVYSPGEVLAPSTILLDHPGMWHGNYARVRSRYQENVIQLASVSGRAGARLSLAWQKKLTARPWIVPSDAPAKTPDDKAPVAKTPDAATVKKQMTPAQLSLGDPVVNSVGMLLVPIPAGTFTMGEGNETPHPVTLTKPFELGVYEVTQQQYVQVMGSNPSEFKGPQNPVEKVSWNDAVEFCRKLSELPSEKSAGYVYRLPTEAEWEYACRAGTQTAYSFGNSESELGDYAWYDENSGGKSHPVGSKKPNAWGLYDMHGNVYEWCQDWYGDYPSGSVTDPTGAASGSVRVFRGGSWFIYSDFCRSAYRDWYTPGLRYFDLGFRVLRSSIK